MFASSVLSFVDSVPLMLVMCDEGLQIFQGSLCDFFFGVENVILSTFTTCRKKRFMATSCIDSWLPILWPYGCFRK